MIEKDTGYIRLTPKQMSTFDKVETVEERNKSETDRGLNHVIVASAVKVNGSCDGAMVEGVVIIGVRHWDPLMQRQANAMGLFVRKDVQGFIDNKYQFLTRQEAWKVAKAAGQIKWPQGGDDVDGGTLFSENLW